MKKQRQTDGTENGHVMLEAEIRVVLSPRRNECLGLQETRKEPPLRNVKRVWLSEPLSFRLLASRSVRQ